MVKKSINQLMEKPMNRREFLTASGSAALAVVGVAAVLRGLDVIGSDKHSGPGYSGGSYGGDSNLHG